MRQVGEITRSTEGFAGEANIVNSTSHCNFITVKTDAEEQIPLKTGLDSDYNGRRL